MHKNFTRPDNHVAAGRETASWLHFHGVVGDKQGAGVENAVVMVLACYSDGTEKPLAHAFTGRDGGYFIPVPKPPYNPGLLKYKVWAAKPHLTEQVFVCPGHEDRCTGPEPDAARYHARTGKPETGRSGPPAPIHTREQNNVSPPVIATGGADNKHGTGPVKEIRGEQSEYYTKLYRQLSRQVPEKIIFALSAPPPVSAPAAAADARPETEHVPKGQFTPATIWYWYLVCLLLCLQPR